MGQISTNDLRGGHKVEIDGQPYICISNEFYKPGKGQATNRIKLKHLMTGRVIEKVLKSGEKVDEADVVESSMRMVYKESDGGAVFMDEKTFEQTAISSEIISDAEKWLKEDLLYDIIFYNNNPVSVQPPTFLDLKIVDTAPGSRGDTVSGRVLKPAILETGAEVQVPIFIEANEKIRVDTRTGEYVSRATE